MHSNTVIVKTLEEKAWREFVDQHPQSNIFHTPEMFRVFERARGHRPLFQAAVDQDGRLLALMLPVLVSLQDGLLRRLTTRAIVYGSVLCSVAPSGPEALSVLLRSYNKASRREALYTELRNHSDLSRLRAVLESNGYTYVDYLDFLIDLDCTAEQVLQNIEARTRKHIRQGLRRGDVSIELISHRDQLSVWYDLVSKTYQRAKVPLADRSLFEAAFDILHPCGMIQYWLARIGSTYVAASAELLYKDVIYGWYSGLDLTYAAEMPGEMLMWHILEWGSQNGYRIYDFGGAGKPTEEYGVRDFKAKFGGRLVCYGRSIWVQAPSLLRLSTFGYDLLNYDFNPNNKLLNPLNKVKERIRHNMLLGSKDGTNEERCD